MHILHFTPQNPDATMALRRTRQSRHVIASALHRDFPEVFGAHPFEPGRVPRGLMDRLDAAYGPLPEVTQECLAMAPEAVLYVKDGLVILYVNVEITDEQAEAVGQRLMRRLQAATLGGGEWTLSITQSTPSLRVTDATYRYWIPSLDLPLRPGAAPEDIQWAEDALGDALYAAIINLALNSPDPEAAIEWLPRRDRIHVEADRGRAEFTVEGDGGMLDLAAYTRVSLQCNVLIEGAVFLGDFAPAGSGLIRLQ